TRSKGRRLTKSRASSPRPANVTLYPSERSTEAQLSRRVRASSTIRIRLEALASAGRARTSRPPASSLPLPVTAVTRPLHLLVTGPRAHPGSRATPSRGEKCAAVVGSAPRLGLDSISSVARTPQPMRQYYIIVATPQQRCGWESGFRCSVAAPLLRSEGSTQPEPRPSVAFDGQTREL